MSQKSIAWEYFKKDEQGITCKSCKRLIKATGNTSNMISHLKHSHPRNYSEYLNIKKRKSQEEEILTENLQSASNTSQNVDLSETKTETVQECTEIPATLILPSTSQQAKEISLEHLSAPTKLALQKSKQISMECFALSKQTKDKITKSLAYFIAADMQPYSIVENEGFQYLLNVCVPGYILPSRKTLSDNLVPKLYQETRAVIETYLSKVSYLSFTTDCWTSVANIPYISLTSHFITDDWQLNYCCLNCAEMSDDHTSENISDCLLTFLHEWNIFEKQVAFTTDHGANIVKAISNLNFSHVSCFGHSINTGVNKIFEMNELQKPLQKVKAIQNLMAHSWKASRELKECQEKYNLPIRKLPSYSKTRWWSLLKLIEAIIEQQIAIMTFLQNYDAGKYIGNVLSIEDIEILKEIINILKPLENISEILSGEKYVTAAVILPIVEHIKTEYSNITDEPKTDLNRKIIKNIVTVINNRYIDSLPSNNLLKICTFLDPRFKANIFNEEAKQTIIRGIITEAEHLFIDTKIEQKIKNWKGSGLAAILHKKNTQETLTDETRIQKDINHYLNMPPIDTEEDPLNWWRIHNSSLRALGAIAKKYLSVQATSVSSERIFSKGGNIITDTRAALTSEHAEQLIFLSINKKYIQK